MKGYSMNIKQRIDELLDETIDRIGQVVAYNSVSVYDENNSTDPFGSECTKVLEAALQMGKDEGFDVVNLDNKVGYIEFGEGDKTIGVLAHLDIVPCGEGWASDPLTVLSKDGSLFGRGVVDDKGPAIACLTAMKIVKEINPNPSKKIRLILGLNEEVGSRCIKHYVEKCGHVDYGFTPDSNFPLIFGEKGSIRGTFSGKSDLFISIDGGTVSNAVCYKVNAVLDNSKVDKDALARALASYPVVYSIKATEAGIAVEVIGKAAHASTPQYGINAISYLMQALKDSGCDDDFVNNYMRVFGLDTTGKNSGIACQDEYGDLTCVTGVIHKENDLVTGSIDIRVPVKHDSKELAKVLAGNSNEHFLITIDCANPALFYDPNSDFIQALLKAYQTSTGDYDSKPLVIGGGTYAQSINNVIAFGPEHEGKCAYNIHDVNEQLPIEELKEMIAVYVQALMNLLAL